MEDGVIGSAKQRTGTIGGLLQSQGDPPTVKTTAELVALISATSEKWQREDWMDFESDADYEINSARLVGQVWFRGQTNASAGLRPGLYRPSTIKDLSKLFGSPVPDHDRDANLLGELFDLEHELRIDFATYGHLLNESDRAKTAIDWYFLMQHHGVPTRLLDWTTNGLAALFFALDDLRLRLERESKPAEDHTANTNAALIAIWMIDAYWLAMRMSDEWSGPLLPWSEDARKYIPPLESLADKMSDSRALLPTHPMPIEPPFVHPRVAAQEGRFIIFGHTMDLLDQRLRLETNDKCEVEEIRVRKIIFEVGDVNAHLRELAQLGVSRRTLFPDFAGLADFVRWKHFHRVSGYRLTGE